MDKRIFFSVLKRLPFFLFLVQISLTEGAHLTCALVSTYTSLTMRITEIASFAIWILKVSTSFNWLHPLFPYHTINNARRRSENIVHYFRYNIKYGNEFKSWSSFILSCWIQDPKLVYHFGLILPMQILPSTGNRNGKRERERVREIEIEIEIHHACQ